VDENATEGDENAEDGYQELLEEFRKKDIAIETLRRGDKLDGLSPEITIEILHPESLSGTPNGDSLVLRIAYGETSVLLMADIGPEEQKEVIGLYGDVARTDAVQVPHHGGSINDDFIKAFTDKIFIISSGPSRWGWPREEDARRLSGDIYRTDRHGTIILESNGLALTVKTLGHKDE